MIESTSTSVPASDSERWDLIIRPHSGLLELHLADLWRYQDLTWMSSRTISSLHKSEPKLLTCYPSLTINLAITPTPS